MMPCKYRIHRRALALQILDMAGRGVDLFDCALPTHIARNGSTLTRRGKFNIKNGRWKGDGGPLDPDCGCFVCRRYSRAYLRHLLNVGEILGLMGMPSEVKVSGEGSLEIVGDGSGLIIGKRGQTLDALQFVVNRIMNKARKEPVYITLDTEGYRQRHVNHLKAMALKMGQKARRTGQSVSLEKMNPYDRRIIHLALKDESGLNTRSIGEGVYKKVVIVPRKASR